MNRLLTTLLVTVALLLCAKCYGQATSVPRSGNEKFSAVPARETAAARFDQGRKWAVVVGVNKYLGTGIPALKYCVADAKLVSKQLIERCGYEEKRVLTLTDDQEEEHLRPLRINLDQQLRGWLSLAAAGDTVFVYFSGHGFLDERGQGFLAPKDCQLNNLGLSAMRTDDLRDMLRQCKATQKLLVLDCCHAGAGKGDAAGSSSQELGKVFKSAEGLVTIASCRKSETSLEWEKKGQGVFTYYLSSGLGGAADFDRNGIVDNLELYRYVADEVPTTAQRELNGTQMPVQIIGDDVAGVFALARVAPALVEIAPQPEGRPVPVIDPTKPPKLKPASFHLFNGEKTSVHISTATGQNGEYVRSELRPGQFKVLNDDNPFSFYDGTTWIEQKGEANCRHNFRSVEEIRVDNTRVGRWVIEVIALDPGAK